MADYTLKWPSSLKKTKPRLLVLEVVQAAETPLSAPEICARLERQNTPLWLSTIYRTLEIFVAHSMLQKTLLPESRQALYEAVRDNSHRHYAVCLLCHRVIPLAHCPLAGSEPVLSEQDFQILGHRLEMFGHCFSCAKKNRRLKSDRRG